MRSFSWESVTVAAGAPEAPGAASLPSVASVPVPPPQASALAMAAPRATNRWLSAGTITSSGASSSVSMKRWRSWGR